GGEGTDAIEDQAPISSSIELQLPNGPPSSGPFICVQGRAGRIARIGRNGRRRYLAPDIRIEVRKYGVAIGARMNGREIDTMGARQDRCEKLGTADHHDLV